VVDGDTLELSTGAFGSGALDALLSHPLDCAIPRRSTTVLGTNRGDREPDPEAAHGCSWSEPRSSCLWPPPERIAAGATSWAATTTARTAAITAIRASRRAILPVEGRC
jgi:hypothetical protein